MQIYFRPCADKFALQNTLQALNMRLISFFLVRFSFFFSAGRKERKMNKKKKYI